MGRVGKFMSMGMILAMVLTPWPAEAASTIQEDDRRISIHEPQSRVSDEIEISGDKGRHWLWILLGVVVIAGGIAAIAGGGEDSDQSNHEADANTGSVSGSW
jgi:hypothetical protein